METKKLGVVELLDKDEVACCDEDVVALLDEGVIKFLDKKNKDDLMFIFSLHTPWNILLRKH